MSLEIIGVLHKILPEQGGVSKNGGNWVKQNFVLETEEKFPKKVCITAWSDQVDQLKKFQPGEKLKVSFDVESREYQDKWYTDIKAWKMEKVGSESNSSAPNHPPRADFDERDLAQASSDVNQGDDLPF